MFSRIKRLIKNIKPVKYYIKGKKILTDSHYKEVQLLNQLERSKPTKRTEIINFLLSLKKGETYYLEIGVRNPNHNFIHIQAKQKYSVDPGVEFKLNPVDFKITSDDFFQKLDRNEILSNDIKFDVIFIDGLHLAEQVDRDIANSLRYINDDGFIVLHDCNPPSEWHGRELFRYNHTPASTNWNGTTWKAFLKYRMNQNLSSCCIDSDFGVGILTKKNNIGKSMESKNPFFEFYNLDKNRKEYLNLVNFDTFKKNLLNEQDK